MDNKVTFTKAKLEHKDAIFKWLQESHMVEFWDMSEEHKMDILNFMNGRKEPSAYYDGRYEYFIGLNNNTPFSLIMAIKEYKGEERPKIKENFLSKIGSTYGLEFCIGNKDFLGCGLAAPTLELFTQFFKDEIDETADTFFIDPYENNTRAKHVYAKAGFELVGDFISNGSLAGTEGKRAFLFIKLMR